MKEFYLSKTFWVNIIALVALVAQGIFGFVVDAQAQAALLIVINLVLRAVTGDEITFGGKRFK
jgi:uncharacterized membrane protein